MNYNGYDILVGNSLPTNACDLIREAGFLEEGEITPTHMPMTQQEEEQGISHQNINNASTGFERTRSQVRGALKAIVGFAFDRFGLPKGNGVDFGCGATGEMVEQLLPPDIDKQSWVQVDINPAAVRENQRRHPGSAIKQGSYLDVKRSLGLRDELDIATGLSSLDSTYFIETAVRQIRRALKIGGFLLHVQDVRPGIGVGFREMQHMGFKPPYPIEALRTTKEVFTYRLPSRRVLSVGELFRRELGRIVESNPNMELLFNEWVTARRPLPQGSIGKMYLLNNLLSLRDERPEEQASAVVTVARRRA